MEPKQTQRSSQFQTLLRETVRESCGSKACGGSKKEDDFSQMGLVPEADTLAVTAAYSRQREVADAKLAEEMTAAEEEAWSAQRKLESEDEMYAAKVETEWADEALAAKLERDYALEAQRERASERLALRRIERADAKIAEEFEGQYESEAKATTEARTSLAARDEHVAKKLQRQVERERHRERKAREVEDEPHESALTIGERWATAESNIELEDVAGAICFSVRLPDLTHVTVKAEKRIVHIDARRAAPLRDRNARIADSSPTHVTLRLEIVAQRQTVNNDDLTFDYDSVSGYLHVYVENLKLSSLANSTDRQEQVKDLRAQLKRSISGSAKAVSGSIAKTLKLIVDSHTK